jgi:4-aminobutyrate aminotransferase/(S)-3-amino-2-methylpropionate transaminase
MLRVAAQRTRQVVWTHHRGLATANPSRPFFPDEPTQPAMKTAVPGPQSKAILNRLNQYQDTRSVFFVAGKGVNRKRNSAITLCL